MGGRWEEVKDPGQVPLRGVTELLLAHQTPFFLLLDPRERRLEGSLCEQVGRVEAEKSEP